MKVINQNRGRFATALSAVALASLVACGGGGGGTSAVTPPPIACPAGGTAGTADQCAKVTGSTNLADGVTVETLTKTGIATTTTGFANVPNGDTTKLYLGATEVGATIPLTFSDITPTSFTAKVGAGLQPFTTYTYVANLTDGILRPFKIVKTFTTGGTACPAPAMANSLGTCMSPPANVGYTWNSNPKAWVANIDVSVTSLNTLPADCVTVGDACWKASSANGTIKYFDSEMVINSRKIVFAGFIFNKPGVGNGYFSLIPIYADSEMDTPLGYKGVDAGYNSDGFVKAKGSKVGVKYFTLRNECWEKVFTGNGVGSQSCSY